jgi:hypothetical protein
MSRQLVLGELVLQAEHHVGHGQVDVLALAGPLPVEQGVAEGREAVHRRGVVGHGEADGRRRPVRVPGEGHDTRGRLDDPVEAGPVGPGAGLPVGRDRDHHDSRVQLAQGLVVQVASLQHPDGEVLDDHVATGHELAQDAQAVLGVPVDAEALLAPVVLDVDTRPAVLDPLQEPARVAVGRQFDLDDLGAQLGQQAGDPGSGQVLRQVEHPVPLEHHPTHGDCLPPGPRRPGPAAVSHARYDRPANIPIRMPATPGRAGG